jgi:catalase
VSGHVVRQPISRTNDYGQAGDRYRSFEPWERDDLIANLVSALSECDPSTQERMVAHLRKCDPGYGRRVAHGLGLTARSADQDTSDVPAETIAG